MRRFKRSHLEARICFLQSDDSRVQSDLSVLCLVVALERAQPTLLQPAEGEDDVRAEVSRDVFWQELSELHAVLRPVGVIADDLVPVLVLLAAFL